MRALRWLAAAALLALAAVLAVEIAHEARHSDWQARKLSRLAADAGFEVRPGPSTELRFPGPGPYDERLGYRSLPQFVERLAPQGYGVAAQARMSPTMIELAGEGLFVPYREKTQAGLDVRDCRAQPLYTVRYPERVYPNFEAVPDLLVDALLFIENRELLDDERPHLNPAFEWDRLGKAVLDRALHLIDGDRPSPGGSTLATQIEKYRHSPEGRTESTREKWRQMASASVRAYLDGEDTLPRRRQIVLDYINTVPLAARPGHGEVHGIGDGMHVWYGRDFAEFNRQLSEGAADDAPGGTERLVGQALAFKQALSLMIAQRRPSHYLGGGDTGLAGLVDAHLRIMADAGVVSTALRDAALPLRLKLAPPPPGERAVSFVERKAATAVRTRLQALLGLPRAYDLDRLDLQVGSPLDGAIQQAATQALHALKTPEGARAAGLYGFRLLNPGDDPSKLIFSFTLYERGEHGNLLRVQTDNFDQPFDINEGARLDLGSTSKLRTLVTYLEIVARLHQRYAGVPAEELRAISRDGVDPITHWAVAQLAASPERDLRALLEAAMERSYSANPAEAFFTGGGLHHFENFDAEHDHRVMSVREALRHSVNLVFIRLMRDVVRHYMNEAPGAGDSLLRDRSDPARKEYLARFADREGREFIVRFFRKYQGKSAADAEDLLLQTLRPTASRLASIFYGLEPDGDRAALRAFLAERLPSLEPSDEALQALQERHGTGRLTLADRGYLAGLHPLELWVVGYLRHHPAAPLSEVLKASTGQRQDVYTWLFKTTHKNAQDVRIQSLREIEAFLEVHRAWRRLGYPFESLTPSYASALGASGDRPAALAELMGLIVNEGVRLPAVRVGSLHFAAGTPYETRLEAMPAQPERLLPAELAATVRAALVDVVQEGTARRLRGIFKLADGRVIDVGGKTGTGDHRFDVHGRGGQLISSRVVNRSATFVFLLGDRYFGTMMAYVHEPYAARYKFTSALPAQLLKSLAPALLPLLERGSCRPAPAPVGRPTQ